MSCTLVDVLLYFVNLHHLAVTLAPVPDGCLYVVRDSSLIMGRGGGRYKTGGGGGK